MKWMRTVAAVLTPLLVSSAAWAGIVGSSHDLRTRLSIDQICVVCHSAHSGDSGEGPLWNHQLTSQAFVREGESITLTGGTKRCMSCHDGVTAVGNFGNITTNTNIITGDDALGTDLSNTHPVSVAYPASGTRTTSFIDQTLLSGVRLQDGKVECGTCHSAHKTDYGDFLRKSNTNSALCVSCHIK